VGDSLREYSFSTLDIDSLGAIAGSVRIELDGKQDTRWELTFQPVGRGKPLRGGEIKDFHAECTGGRLPSCRRI